MDRLAITSITNFLLAAELFFVAGMMVRTVKARFTPAWFWAVAVTALAASSLLGGIDHGFVEPAGLDRYWIQRPNWLVMGVMTFCTLQAAGGQFLPARWLPVRGRAAARSHLGKVERETGFEPATFSLGS